MAACLVLELVSNVTEGYLLLQYLLKTNFNETVFQFMNSTVHVCCARLLTACQRPGYMLLYLVVATSQLKIYGI